MYAGYSPHSRVRAKNHVLNLAQHPLGSTGPQIVSLPLGVHFHDQVSCPSLQHHLLFDLPSKKNGAVFVFF